MKTLYLECAMGAAGDMLMAALLSLVPSANAFVERMNALGLPGVHVSSQTAARCGITGLKVSVRVHGVEEESLDESPHKKSHEHPQEHIHMHEDGHAHVHIHSHDHGHDHPAHDHDHRPHAHAGMDTITALIESLPISAKCRADALSVYRLIANAESHAHGVPVDQVHFHEVGAMDAVADIVGVCLLMEALGPDRVVVSPIHVGSGQVRCAHGILPVPAPATAHILRGASIYGGDIQGELCTPTGAALLRHFATEFGGLPLMTPKAIGYGMGKKEFKAANCVRAIWGESGGAQGGPNGKVEELSCNVDDMTGEALGYAVSTLFSLGALDVFIVPVQMKKNRPGQWLHCLCDPKDADSMAASMLEHTTTFGVRRQTLDRYTLARAFHEVGTPYGPVRVKTGEGYGVLRSKPEYDDLLAAAERHGVSMESVRASLPGTDGQNG